MLVKMVNVMTGRKLHRTDSKFLQLIIHVLNQGLNLKGLNSGGSWICSPNLINEWFLIKKASENSSINN